MTVRNDPQQSGSELARPTPPAPTKRAELLEPDGPSLEEAAVADDFDAGTDAPLGRAGVDRALAND